MELKFVIPNMEKTFGNLEFAGEDKTEQRRINGRMAVLSRSFNLYSDVQRADDIVVILPAEAGEKHFDFEERVKLVNPRITAEGDIPIADAEVKNRFEIRLKNERAFYAIRDLLEHDNPERTAFQIINRYVRFVDKDDTKPRSDWRISEEWAWFIGEHRGSLKLTTKPEPYSFERTLHWLSHQVAPTLKLALRLDKMNHTQIVHDIITHAKLTEKHEKILKQQAAAAKEVVL